MNSFPFSNYDPFLLPISFNLIIIIFFASHSNPLNFDFDSLPLLYHNLSKVIIPAFLLSCPLQSRLCWAVARPASTVRIRRAV